MISNNINFTNHTFDLGSKYIYTASVGLDYRFYKNFHIFGNATYERFEYGQSSLYSHLLTTYVNGIPVYSVQDYSSEPNSVTNEIIYSIGIGYSF